MTILPVSIFANSDCASRGGQSMAAQLCIAGAAGDVVNSAMLTISDVTYRVGGKRGRALLNALGTAPGSESNPTIWTPGLLTPGL
jgi:hypothetical protein